MEQISSRRNPLVDTFRDTARGGPGSLDMLLEGEHLVREAVESAMALSVLAVTSRWSQAPATHALIAGLSARGTRVVEVAETVMHAASPARTPSGMLAIARRPHASLEALLAAADALTLIACGVQDPGNLGAILRAAEAGGATGIIVTGDGADPYGWKAVRGSMGSAFRMPVATVRDTASVVTAARAARLAAVALEPRAGVSLYDADLRQPCAILLGGEGGGLTPDLIEGADVRVSIPMRLPVESLNVAVAAALVVYEAARQRTVRG